VTVNEGREALLALTDAGVSLQDLEAQCDPLQDNHVFTEQVGSSPVMTSYKFISDLSLAWHGMVCQATGQTAALLRGTLRPCATAAGCHSWLLSCGAPSTTTCPFIACIAHASIGGRRSKAPTLA
jgi:hypothetical protein